MGKNVILPEQTVRDLLEAYASLSAWYYQLWGAVRSGTGNTQPPTEATRSAFLARLAQDYPELAQVARGIPAPRPFVPPPPALPSTYTETEPATLIEPAPARLKEMQSSAFPSSAPAQAPAPEPAPAAGGPAPPPFIAPGTVKY